MKHKEKQTREVNVVVRVTCDLCGEERPRRGWMPLLQGVLVDGHVDVRIEFRQADESGHRIKLDVCPKCFWDKILPLAMRYEIKDYYR